MNHKKLKSKLNNGGYTCIAYGQKGLFYSSYLRGIAPLVLLCEKSSVPKKLFIGDKVIGKAAALLCIKCGAAVLYADVISKDAISILSEHKVSLAYRERVDYIKNRSGDGKCPMEGLAYGVSSPDIMYKKAKAFIEGIR